LYDDSSAAREETAMDTESESASEDLEADGEDDEQLGDAIPPGPPI
jgi:hypothetical protein